MNMLSLIIDLILTMSDIIVDGEEERTRG